MLKRVCKRCFSVALRNQKCWGPSRRHHSTSVTISSPKDTSLRADLKAVDFARQKFAGQLPQAASKAEQESSTGFKMKHLLVARVCGGVLGGVLAVVAAPAVLTAVGFASVGIAASSIAAGMMSSAAIANGGAVAAGSAVAVLQSVGAAGLGVAGTAAVGGAGAAAGTAVAGAVGAVHQKVSKK